MCVNFGLALKNPTLHVLGLGISELRCTGHVEYLAAVYSRSLFSADLLSADLHSAAFCKILI